MQVILRIFRARQRPVVFLAPLVFPHHENPDWLFFLDAVRFSLQQPVVPSQRQLIPIDGKFFSKVHCSDFPAVPPSSLPSDVPDHPLPLPSPSPPRLLF